MSETVDRLQAGLAGRYQIARELGRGDPELGRPPRAPARARAVRHSAILIQRPRRAPPLRVLRQQLRELSGSWHHRLWLTTATRSMYGTTAGHCEVKNATSLSVTPRGAPGDQIRQASFRSESSDHAFEVCSVSPRGVGRILRRIIAVRRT